MGLEGLVSKHRERAYRAAGATFDQRGSELAAAPMPAPPRVIRSNWMQR
jgi:hypothetical protein